LSKVRTLDSSRKSDFFYLYTLGMSLRRENYDVIINLSNSLRNTLLTTLARPGRIVSRNRNRIHAVDAFFNSAQEVFHDIEKPEELKLYTSNDAEAFIENEIQGYERPFIVINPAGDTDHIRQGRIWSLGYWTELSNKLVEKYGGTIFIVGSKQEKKYHQELSKINSSVLFSGVLDLEKSAALFAEVDLFISGDSGPLHMASALGVKTLGLMGSTPTRACGPYGTKGYAISPLYKCACENRKFCTVSQSFYKPCIQSITPEVVLDFIDRNNMLSSSRRVDCESAKKV